MLGFLVTIAALPTVSIYKGEIWKYGKTCNGEQGRYPNGLPVLFLDFKPEFNGTEKECLSNYIELRL